MKNPNARGYIRWREPARNLYMRTLTEGRFNELSQYPPMDWDEFVKANTIYPDKKPHVHRLSDF